MKRFGWLLLGTALLTTCRRGDAPLPNTPGGNFTAFWQDFERHYAGFALPGTPDWDSLRRAVEPRVTASMPDTALFGVLSHLILSLRDAHATPLVATNLNARVNFYTLATHRKPANYLGWRATFDRYVQAVQNVRSNISYGQIGPDVGYLAIASFADAASDYLVIDEFLSRYATARGIILDVRHNGGGDEANARTVASRFADRERVYRYARLRNGPGRTDLGDFQPLRVGPAGPRQFTRPVVLLTNRRTFSAAEDFTLMLRSLPHVSHVGDTTLGGAATRPAPRTLPNGWTYRMPEALSYQPDRQSIQGGIAPQVPVWMSRADSLAGRDRLLEEALRRLRP